MKLSFIGILLTLLFVTQISSANDIPCAECKSVLQQANCLYKLGESNLSEKGYENAINLFSEGIKAIGNDYNTDHSSIDDSGQKLTLAKIEKERGNLEVASNLYKGVLSSRISIISDSSN